MVFEYKANVDIKSNMFCVKENKMFGQEVPVFEKSAEFNRNIEEIEKNEHYN